MITHLCDFKVGYPPRCCGQPAQVVETTRAKKVVKRSLCALHQQMIKRQVY